MRYIVVPPTLQFTDPDGRLLMFPERVSTPDGDRVVERPIEMSFRTFCYRLAQEPTFLNAPEVSADSPLRMTASDEVDLLAGTRQTFEGFNWAPGNLLLLSDDLWLRLHRACTRSRGTYGWAPEVFVHVAPGMLPFVNAIRQASAVPPAEPKPVPLPDPTPATDVKPVPLPVG